jgi:hypothetical protein
MVSIDFFTVPTATFRILYIFLVLSHKRRRVIHFNVTEFPSARWTARQLIEAFPWDPAPKFLLRDRDSIYGHEVVRTIHNLCAEQVLTAPRSPWQNPYVERVTEGVDLPCGIEGLLDNMPDWCRGPGMDGSQHPDDGLRMLQEWGLLEVFGVEVQKHMAG